MLPSSPYRITGHCAFGDGEPDLIANHDIKYRMSGGSQQRRAFWSLGVRGLQGDAETAGGVGGVGGRVGGLMLRQAIQAQNVMPLGIAWWRWRRS